MNVTFLTAFLMVLWQLSIMSCERCRATLVILSLLLSLPSVTLSQTCCSAGAPITSAFDIPGRQNRALSFGLEYEYNAVNWLVEHDNRLENDPRRRHGSSVLARVNLSIGNSWAFGVYLPFVTQVRSSFSSEQKASGIGDLTLLAQHTSPLGSGSLKWGVGIKMPSGNQFITDEIGVILSPDMQSGSGTFDFIGRVALVRDHLIVSNLYNQTDITFRYNSENSHFGDRNRLNGRRFKFGNEVLISTVFSYLVIFRHWFLIPDLGVQFRHASPNQEQGMEASNSGGNWFRFLLGVRWTAHDRFSVRPYAEIPVWQRLEGTQITTNLKLGMQLQYVLDFEKSEDALEPIIY